MAWYSMVSYPGRGCRACIGIRVQVLADRRDAPASDDAGHDGSLRVVPALAHVEENPGGLSSAQGIPFLQLGHDTKHRI